MRKGRERVSIGPKRHRDRCIQLASEARLTVTDDELVESSAHLGVNPVHRRMPVELRLLDTVSVSLVGLVVGGMVLGLEGHNTRAHRGDKKVVRTRVRGSGRGDEVMQGRRGGRARCSRARLPRTAAPNRTAQRCKAMAIVEGLSSGYRRGGWLVGWRGGDLTMGSSRRGHPSR